MGRGSAVDQSQPAGLSVEQILAVDGRAFWISGWVHDADGHGDVTLVSPESARVPVLEAAFRYERPDVVHVLEELPLSSTYRPDVRALQAMGLSLSGLLQG